MRRILGVGIATALVLVLAACGDDSDGPDSSNPDTVTTQPAAPQSDKSDASSDEAVDTELALPPDTVPLPDATLRTSVEQTPGKAWQLTYEHAADMYFTDYRDVLEAVGYSTSDGSDLGFSASSDGVQIDVTRDGPDEMQVVITFE